jgi:hypothetical protein
VQQQDGRRLAGACLPIEIEDVHAPDPYGLVGRHSKGRHSKGPRPGGCGSGGDGLGSLREPRRETVRQLNTSDPTSRRAPDCKTEGQSHQKPLERFPTAAIDICSTGTELVQTGPEIIAPTFCRPNPFLSPEPDWAVTAKTPPRIFSLLRARDGLCAGDPRDLSEIVRRAIGT